MERDMENMVLISEIELSRLDALLRMIFGVYVYNDGQSRSLGSYCT